MQLLSFVVGSILISGIFAGVREDIEKCRDDHLNREFLEKFKDNLPSAQDMETLCPMILGFMECGENAFEKETSMSVEQLAETFPDPVAKDAVKFYINARSIIRDTCTEGSDLNEAYKEHGPCISTVDIDDEVCRESANTAYDTYRQLQNSPGSETGRDMQRDCMVTAYMSACLASRIHEECGLDAFNFYQQVLKRSSYFKLALCSEEGLENLKTGFLNSLELEEERHDIFRLAFDLRKRRK